MKYKAPWMVAIFVITSFNRDNDPYPAMKQEFITLSLFLAHVGINVNAIFSSNVVKIS